MHAQRGTVGYDANVDEAARHAAKQASRDKNPPSAWEGITLPAAPATPDADQVRVLRDALVELWDFVVSELDPDPAALPSYLAGWDLGDLELLIRALPARCLVDPSG